MPKQPATSATTFNEFLSAAAAKLPDPQLRNQFTATFGDLLQNLPTEAVSSLDNHTNTSVMFHRDYSRLVADHRQQQQQLQQQVDAISSQYQQLQQLQQQAATRIDPAEYNRLQQQLDQLQAKAQWAETLRDRLDSMDLTEAVLDQDELDQFRQIATGEIVTMPNNLPATPSNPDPTQQPTTPQPVWVNGQWMVPVAQQQQPSMAGVPTQSATPDIDALVAARVQEALGQVLPQMAAQVYGAATQTSQEVSAFTQEWAALKGETIDPRQLNQEFVSSGKQFNEFLEDRYKLSEVRELKRQQDFEAAVAAKATEVAQQRIAELTTSNGLRNGVPANPGSTPLFDAIANKPAGLRQAWSQNPAQNYPQPTPGQPPAPQAAPTATPNTQLPATPPPQPGDDTGVSAAARALATGMFSNARFDPTRPMGVPGQ